MQKNTKDLSTKNSNKKTTTNKKEEVVKRSSNIKTTKKNSTKKVTSTETKKTDTKKTTSKKSSKKVSSTTQKKVVTKKTTSKTTKPKKTETVEYYDLPYRYNETIVKILAQTPNTLFVYWDISDNDREKYIKEFGENFFNSTIPVLIVHNKTMNYSFEIEINDFANSWYFNINDPKCEYEIELGRRAKPNTIDLPNNYMHVTTSNVLETPNNHILFEKNQKVLFFRNVKDNTRFEKNVSNFNFMQYAGKANNIYDIYKKIYTPEELQNLHGNPSSSFNKGEV